MKGWTLRKEKRIDWLGRDIELEWMCNRLR